MVVCLSMKDLPYAGDLSKVYLHNVSWDWLQLPHDPQRISGMERWMDGWIDVWIDGWMDRWMDRWMDAPETVSTLVLETS